MAFSVHTDQFSGPFDLLLRLVATQKLAIEDIQISEICDQYLQELDRLQSFDIALTADFFGRCKFAFVSQGARAFS